MSPGLILLCIGCYFGVLLTIAWHTARGSTSRGYYLGNKNSPWYAVAFGYIGDSLSGVTFISVPGQVAGSKFSYLQVVLGYLVGYAIIASVLLPLYYRLNLTSIYSYLGSRFGPRAQKTGAFFFLISRTTGAAARLYLAGSVLQSFIFDVWGVPVAVTISLSILLMLADTLRGGIKTLVWTDTFQSTFLLLGLGLSIVAIARSLGLDLWGVVNLVRTSEMSQIFFWDWKEKTYFWKQFLSGIFLAVAMNGLDQNMMQKNLSCRTLGEAKTNLYAFSIVMVLVNVAFLSLGVLLHHFALSKGIAMPARTDALFPTLALQHLGMLASVAFIFGLTAATFSSADSVLTTLTTSFCLDFLKQDTSPATEAEKTRNRYFVHAGFSFVLLIFILAFRALGSDAVINAILRLAGYTYGPLLGLFTLGLTTQRPIRDRLIPWVCCASPLACLVLEDRAPVWFGGYRFGFELLLVNAFITAFVLWSAPSRDTAPISPS